MRPSTCTQALNHHVIVANNTALTTSTRDTARPPDRPPARIRGNTKQYRFLHVRSHPRTRVATSKNYGQIINIMALYVGAGASVCNFSHVRTR